MKTALRGTFVLFFLFISSQLFAMGKQVIYQLNGVSYQGYYVSPGQNAPLVILVHDWDGLTDYEVKRSEMLAGMGYAVFAVDLFGVGVKADSIAERRQLTGDLYGNRTKMRSLLNAGVVAAKSQGGNTDRAIMAGYCFGGAAVLEFARSGADLKGFVTFHGGLVTPEGQDYKTTKGKVMVFHGTADQSVSMAHFADIAVELEKTGVPHEMVTYSGAPHAFSVFGSTRYHEEADKKSWKRFLEFLDETLKNDM